MSSFAIRVEGLSKRYRLGARSFGRQTFRETLAAAAAAPFRRWRKRTDSTELRGMKSPNGEAAIWALKDVSFEVRPGQVLGVIGRNGAGKSTLLKILSRITEPTAGYADVNGRLGSLLEVGTGFHPELTGRENVFLNGAILGMKRAEIRRKFDEIVAFAEVEKFIDTPVKHYSSGMYVRLAFAVAAHLQPEILLVDEVLAVGDIEFQKKCIGRMDEVVRQGNTVVIVSHNMATIRALCTAAVLLDRGSVEAVGEPDPVINLYLGSSSTSAAERAIAPRDHDEPAERVRATRVRLLNAVANTFSVHWLAPIRVALDIEVTEPVTDLVFGVNLRTVDDTDVLTAHSDLCAGVPGPAWDLAPGRYTVEFALDNPLRPGLYKLSLGAASRHHLGRSNFLTLEAALLEVLDFSAGGVTPRPSCAGVVNATAGWAITAGPVPCEASASDG